MKIQEEVIDCKKSRGTLKTKLRKKGPNLSSVETMFSDEDKALVKSTEDQVYIGRLMCFRGLNG